ncbi:MAG: hypothetical protein AAB035_06310 [Nitrospirota bacterium]
MKAICSPIKRLFLLQGTLIACTLPFTTNQVAIKTSPPACCKKPCPSGRSDEEAKVICNLTVISQNASGSIQTERSLEKQGLAALPDSSQIFRVAPPIALIKKVHQKSPPQIPSYILFHHLLV